MENKQQLKKTFGSTFPLDCNVIHTDWWNPQYCNKAFTLWNQ